MIRFFDVLFSAIGLILLSPILISIGLLIKIESKGGSFYTQERIGKMVIHLSSTNLDP